MVAKMVNCPFIKIFFTTRNVPYIAWATYGTMFIGERWVGGGLITNSPFGMVTNLQEQTCKNKFRCQQRYQNMSKKRPSAFTPCSQGRN